MLTAFFLFKCSPIIYHLIGCGVLGLEYWLGKTEKVKSSSIVELVIVASIFVFLKLIEAKEKLLSKGVPK